MAGGKQPVATAIDVRVGVLEIHVEGLAAGFAFRRGDADDDRGITVKANFLIVIAEFDGMSGGALWQDLKVGIEHLRAWKRIALVTDIEWMRHLTAMFGWMTPGDGSPAAATHAAHGSP